MEFIRRGFHTISFKGSFSLGLMDPRHILIRFEQEEDFHRCWLHGSWSFKKHVMRVLKWTPSFSIAKEPTVVPVWISMEHLPLYLFRKGPLFSIGNLIGRSLKIDQATANLTRPSTARVCVELDLDLPLPNRIWIGTGESGFWQPLTYENLPAYCRTCHCLGHDSDHCLPEHVDPVPKKPPPVQQVWKSKIAQPVNPVTTAAIFSFLGSAGNTSS